MALRTNIVQRGDHFQTTGGVLGGVLEWVDKDQAERGAKKDRTVARTVGYGEWTSPLYAQMTLQFPCQTETSKR